MTDEADTGGDSGEQMTRGASPYSTGGGGVTLERRVAALQLMRLLTGATAVELHGRRVERVGFQQAPPHPVDDLLVTAARDDGSDRLEIAVAIRRAPAFVASDKDTEKLVGAMLAELRIGRSETEKRIAICVAGPQRAAQQVAQLAALARDQANAAGFFALVRTPGRFQQDLAGRLEHLVTLVVANLSETGSISPSASAEAATWQLLGRLDVLMPRLETPDETDWNHVVNQLEPWAREPTIAAATALRDRLESLAAAYGPAAADVDLPKLRREAHDVLQLERRRGAMAWRELHRLDEDARAAVREAVGVEVAGGASLHLARTRQASMVLSELHPGPPVLVSGESGVGKSVLVIGELKAAAASDPRARDVVVLNLRLLPRTMAELREALGAPVEDVLSEMSAPDRVLVLDAADVILERDHYLLASLMRAAIDAGVTPWVIAAADGLAAVRDVVKTTAGAVREVIIDGLEDSDLDEVATAFPQMRRLLAEPRARELLRRPAIVDLFVRAGGNAFPLSEADALDIVWAKLIRNDERATRGMPDARDQVMRQLATQQLRSSQPVTTYTGFDAAALAGLQHDGLVHRGDRWHPLPMFAHDLLRTFAVAQVLLSTEDPIGEFVESGAPRWALPAARLAVQVLLTAPDSQRWPLAGRLARTQVAVDRLTAAGHGDRWADLPTEALLTLPNAGSLLADAWGGLTAEDADGLRRLLRIIQQRYGRSGVIDRLIAEPVVWLLLDNGWTLQLHEQVHDCLCAWLRGLVLAREPGGHSLRIALRERLVARVAAGDKRIEDVRHEQAARMAARTPEEVAADEERARKVRAITPLLVGGHRRRPLRELPQDLTDDDLLEELALLGADLGDEGAALLRRVAADAPHHLAPAVEQLLSGHSLVTYDSSLLSDLTEAYYIEERNEDEDWYDYGGPGDDGIRDHEAGGISTPLAAFYRGPFLALFRADPRAGIRLLNRMLNHAACARVQVLRHLTSIEAPEPEDHYITELDITGERRRYVGDDHVWMWYRGTGVGPYPCMSALQALELVCDECLKAEVPLRVLVRLLLDGCENLAMPALVLGILVRHMECAGKALDPFLAEPVVWHLEFSRTMHEHSGLAAQTEGIVAPERRRWNLRDIAVRLTLNADANRIEELHAVGRRLLARAAELEGPRPDGEPLSEALAAVRGWAGSLDRDSYSVTETEEGLLVEQVPDPDAVARLAASNANLARNNEATRILMRYPERFDRHVQRRTVTREELAVDLASARELADTPPTSGFFGAFHAPAAVAAATLEARFVHGIAVLDDDVAWAARLLVELMNALADQGASDDDYAVFGRGPDHAAARGLPLLALPAASRLRDQLNAGDVSRAAINRAVTWIVEHASNETRLFLARAFDPLWRSPCVSSDAACHHVIALAVIEDTARECVLGPWDPSQQRTARLHIEGRVAPQLEASVERVDVLRLSATIRGAAAAAVSTSCCRGHAAELLAAALRAHRRAMRAMEHGYMHSPDDAAAAARAVLNLAAVGDTTLLFEHLDGYADHPRLLGEFLRALAAAGEETPGRAAAARDVWPAVLDRVVGFVASGVCARDDRHYGNEPLAAVIPTLSYDAGYLHREYEGAPIPWADPEALAPKIEQWLPLAAGCRETVDALAHLLDRLPPERQATLGLPWMERLVMAAPEEVAGRSFLIARWLEQVRPHATEPPLRAAWHKIVDALTVAGDKRVADLAD